MTTSSFDGSSVVCSAEGVGRGRRVRRPPRPLRRANAGAARTCARRRARTSAALRTPTSAGL